MGYFVGVSNDVNIYVEDLNPESQRTILFLHGWPANLNLFEYQFDRLPQAGFRCIGIDTRGLKVSCSYTCSRNGEDNPHHFSGFLQ